MSVRALVLLGCGLLAVACGGAGYRDGVYRDGEVAFRIEPPAGAWRTVEQDGTALALRSENSKSTLALQFRCHQDGDDVPLTALTHHLFLYFEGRTLVSQREELLDGRAALRTELDAKLDGVPKEFIATVLKKDGCVYDFLLITEQGGRAVLAPTYDAWRGSFHTLGAQP